MKKHPDKPFFRQVLWALVLTVCFQKAKAQAALELTLYGRYDKHGDYRLPTREGENRVQLYGVSKGARAGYRKRLSPSVSVTGAVGWYQLGVNTLRVTQLPYGPTFYGDTRPLTIQTGSGTAVRETDGYHYNDFSLHAGIEKAFFPHNPLRLTVGLEGVGYKSFSHVYRIAGAGFYTATGGKPVEWGINANVGIERAAGDVSFKPFFLLPVFQQLRGDEVFADRETSKMRVSKWFPGIGFGVTAGLRL